MITITAPTTASAGSSICITVSGATGDVAVLVDGPGALSSIVFENGLHKITIKTNRGGSGGVGIEIGANGGRYLRGVVVY